MHGCVVVYVLCLCHFGACMMGELKGRIPFYLAGMLHTIIPWPRNTWLSAVFLCPLIMAMLN